MTQLPVYRLTAVVSRALATAGLGILLVLAAFTMLDGLTRSFLNQPIDLVREIGDLVAAVGAACCLPITLLERGNITLRAFGSVASPRILRLIEVSASAIVLAVLAAMAWQFFLFAQKTAAAGEVTWLLIVPKAPFWFAIDAIFWVCVAVQVCILFDDVVGDHSAKRTETAL